MIRTGLAIAALWLIALVETNPASDAPERLVKVKLAADGGLDLVSLLERLSEATSVRVPIPDRAVSIPLRGPGAPLSRTLIEESFARLATVRFEADAVEIRIQDDSRPDAWRDPLLKLSLQAFGLLERRSIYGLRPLRSYRPNDDSRPTVCLLHGLNSTSGVFKHLIPVIESAGYGVVVYDFPHNQDLDQSSRTFVKDWQTFRDSRGDRRPWALVSHSMGGLLARFYVEGADYRGDVASMILIAPPNSGSNLAQAQTLLQLIQGMRAIDASSKGELKSNPLASLGDGVGESARDLLAGSHYLKSLNARGIRKSVPYHILAGDIGLIRRPLRDRIDGIANAPGFVGGLSRLTLANSIKALDEMSDGAGDGCVSVRSTKLDGVADHKVLHANHLELIRAPLLFPEPGPITGWPDVRDWLNRDLPVRGNR
jgi:pimeloyl-ACP methyl ester carboxylesterase